MQHTGMLAGRPACWRANVYMRILSTVKQEQELYEVCDEVDRISPRVAKTPNEASFLWYYLFFCFRERMGKCKLYNCTSRA